jgi:hypothetical protein
MAINPEGAFICHNCGREVQQYFGPAQQGSAITAAPPASHDARRSLDRIERVY